MTYHPFKGLGNRVHIYNFNFFLKWCINLGRLNNAKAILVEEHSWLHLIHNYGNPAFLKDISSKVNVLARLEFEFSYFEVSVEQVSNKTTVTLPPFCAFVLHIDLRSGQAVKWELHLYK